MSILKLLFLANRLPYPPYRGDKLKIYNLAKRLCHQHELHLLTFVQNEEDKQYVKELEQVFKRVHVVSLPKWSSALHCLAGLWSKKPFQVHYFSSKAMRNQLNEIISENSFDAIHVQHLRMAQYLHKEQHIPRILDLPDAFSLYWQRKQAHASNPILKWLEGIEQSRVYQYERILASYNLSLVCSTEDQAYLVREHHLNNIALLPNGVATDTFAPQDHDYSHNHTLLFTGNMDYKPNIDAVIYFTTSILPLIQERFPQIRFIIAGQRPVAKVLALANEHVIVTGFVPDMAAQYNEASVVVAPLRFGAGTQNKVLEAMSMGVPVVCSHIGFNGLGIASGEGAIMQTDTKAFAASVIDLLSSATLRQSVGAKGIALIQKRYAWDIIAAQLNQYFHQITAQQKSS